MRKIYSVFPGVSATNYPFTDVITILSGDTLMLIDPHETSLGQSGENTFTVDLWNMKDYMDQMRPFLLDIFGLDEGTVNEWSVFSNHFGAHFG